MHKQNLGRKGEELATTFLIEKGFEILHKNWRYKKAEIDIIGVHQEFLVFVEVKTRSSDYFGKPEESVTSEKEELYKTASEYFIEKYELENEIRFDVISIIVSNNKNTIEHFVSAF